MYGIEWKICMNIEYIPGNFKSIASLHQITLASIAKPSPWLPPFHILFSVCWRICLWEGKPCSAEKMRYASDQERWSESLSERLHARQRMSDSIDVGGHGVRLSICELSRDSWKRADGYVSESHWLCVSSINKYLHNFSTQMLFPFFHF